MSTETSTTSLRVTLTRSVDDSYAVHIGARLLENLRACLPALPRRVAIVSDTVVFALYGAALRRALEAAGHCVTAEAVFPAGEQHKTRETKAWVEDRLLAAKLGRDGWIAALGGGVVGDLAGYTAATYLRGIPFVQFPTTLLAMVDSSVGGKTGVDTPAGKNLVGAFWQPRAVVADLQFLTSLPDDQFQAGLAEVIKHAVIADAAFFARLEQEWEQVAARRPETLAGVVRANCAIKASVVERDERESDLRKILNFGHTLGHAVETAAAYTLMHGACVAIGMRYEASLAVRLGLLSAADQTRLERLLDRAGFARADTLAVTSEELLALTRQDKKAREGEVEYVFPASIGAMASGERGFGVRVAAADVLAVLHAARGR